jgi:chemotaxis signal transduction protein
MNKTLWKLDKIGDRLWIVAMDAAQQAGALGERGLAVVADETRRLANELGRVTERALFEGGEINEEKLTELATQLNFLALNCAIESSRLGQRGKAAAVCADEIRGLAFTVVNDLFRKAEYEHYSPHPKDCVSTVTSNQQFISFKIGSLIISENIENIKEVIGPIVKRTENHISFREQTVRLADPFLMMGEAKDAASYIILKTPWAEQNKTYGVAIDSIIGLYFSPVGKPVDAPTHMPLAAYVRECWDSENGEPIYFMDWTKIALQ